MAYIGEEQDVMRPEKGDSFITLPITFDYSGGRRDFNKKKAIYSVGTGVLGIVLFFYFLMNNEINLILRLVLAVASIIIASLVIRFVFLKEKVIREQYEKLEATDFQVPFKEVWGIFEIDNEYPYFVRYRNGRTGVFIGLNKDVVLGKYSDSEFEHYEAIGDAYNVAGANNISMGHIDYMDLVGSDDRLQESFAGLSDVENADIKNILMDVYGHIQTRMDEKVTTQDVYVFTFVGNEITAWNSILRVISCMMDANFVSYHVLDSNDIRELFKTIFNVHDFSVNKAMLSTFDDELSNVGIIPIQVTHRDGTVEKFNLTSEEKKEKADRDKLKKKLKEDEKKRRKKKSRNKKDDDLDKEVDIF